MSAVIFTGPTLSAVDARMVLEADYRPPAAEGDVYRAAQAHPHLIGIIDGYFERIPAVWHKEILWAMSHGIHVFGAGSMGAGSTGTGTGSTGTGATTGTAMSSTTGSGSGGASYGGDTSTRHTDWGWIGLIGLAGLLGLRRKGEVSDMNRGRTTTSSATR